MRIRSATLSDIPSMLPMIARMCALHQEWDGAKYGFLPEPELLYQRWLTRLIPNQRDLCLVAEPDDSLPEPRLVAFLIATVEQELPLYQVKEFAFVHDVWVEDGYRHLGVARQLMQQAIAHFTYLGIPQIRLDTVKVNDAARRLFTSCGFRISTIEMLIELDGTS
jgi:ribosomal protein S18 acetylase RimI-like enzyme